MNDADALIRQTIDDVCGWLDWTPASLQRRSAGRGQPLSDTHWKRYLSGEVALSDRIARSIAAVLSLPDPAQWTAARLREALDSDYETLLEQVWSSMASDLSATLRQSRSRRPPA